MFLSGRIAEDKAIPGKNKQVRFEPKLSECVFSGSNSLCEKNATLARDIGTAVVNAHLRAVFERTVRSRRNFQSHIENLARPAKLAQRDHVASMNVLRGGDVGQIERSARTRHAKLNVTIVGLDVADASGFSGWLDRNTLAASQSAAGQRAGDHRADALQCKDAINRQPRFADIARRGRVRPEPVRERPSNRRGRVR